MAKILDGTQKIGYARVSTDDQNITMQIDALEREGCDVIYKDDGVSGVKYRAGLARALKALRPGDTLVFWKLDRLGRGALDLLTMLEDFQRRGINLKSLTEPIDTSNAMGKAFYGVAAVFAELFRSLNKENQRAGIEAAKRRGKHLGRPRKLNDAQIALALELMGRGEQNVNSMAEVFAVDRGTLYRAIRRQKTASVSNG